MLDARDWAAMEDVKVDRSQIEVLKMARKMMADGGVLSTDDLSKTGGAAVAAKQSIEATCPMASAAAAPASEPAAAAAPAAAASEPAPPALAFDPADWASAVDPASGQTYYYNAQTGATSWDWPPA